MNYPCAVWGCRLQNPCPDEICRSCRLTAGLIKQFTGYGGEVTPTAVAILGTDTKQIYGITEVHRLLKLGPKVNIRQLLKEFGIEPRVYLNAIPSRDPTVTVTQLLDFLSRSKYRFPELSSEAGVNGKASPIINGSGHEDRVVVTLCQAKLDTYLSVLELARAIGISSDTFARYFTQLGIRPVFRQGANRVSLQEFERVLRAVEDGTIKPAAITKKKFVKYMRERT